MTTYTIVVEGKATRDGNVTNFEIMQMCAGGGVIAFDNGVIVEFFDKDDAIKAKETLEANGVKLLSDIFESDNPIYVQYKEDDDD